MAERRFLACGRVLGIFAVPLPAALALRLASWGGADRGSAKTAAPPERAVVRGAAQGHTAPAGLYVCAAAALLRGVRLRTNASAAALRADAGVDAAPWRAAAIANVWNGDGLGHGGRGRHADRSRGIQGGICG